MNLTDLAEVLRDHADHADLPPDAGHGSRMAGVRARVRASRWQRAAAVAASLVAVVGVAFAVTAPSRSESRPAEPPVFAEYHQGTRIVAQTSGRAPTSTVSVRFVPTTPDPEVFITCDGGGARLVATVTVDGHQHRDLACGLASRVDVDRTARGVAVGVPMTVTMSVQRYVHDPVQNLVSSGPVPPDAVFGLAVGVPVEGHPPMVPGPGTSVLADAVEVLRSSPGRANGTWRTSVALPKGPFHVEVAAHHPGRFRVLVNGVEVLEYAKWTGDVSSSGSLRHEHWEEQFGLAVAPGAAVEITVVAERTAGEWTVVLRGR